jgi:NADH-quinone oxidoreductase subunit A
LNTIILTPPLAFLIVLTASLSFLKLLSGLSFKCKPEDEACRKSYACGEDVPTSMIQPDYSAFFPFAFLFTILHVVALVVATAPLRTVASLAMALIYVAGAVTALFVLFRRNV